MPEIDLQHEIQKLAETAVRMAAVCDIKLDYSPASIERVDELLEHFRTRFRLGFMTRLFRRKQQEAELSDNVTPFGAYLGEVMRREWGGNWTRTDFEGIPVVALQLLGGISVHPFGKVLKRVRYGKEDSVWFYFQVLERQVEEFSAPIKP